MGRYYTFFVLKASCENDLEKFKEIDDCDILEDIIYNYLRHYWKWTWKSVKTTYIMNWLENWDW